MNQHFLLLLSIFLMSSATRAATTMVFPQLPEADTFDTEVSTNRTFAITRNQLEVVLELDATATNNVEVAFGVDVNENGILDVEEEICSLGWDCGAWFISNKTTGETVASECESGRRKLSVTFDFAANGASRHLKATDNVTLILSESKELPRSLMNQSANLMRITARGKGQHLENLSMTNRQIGIAFLVR